ncbi:MAG: ParB/RepB/Spo0J family partition protein [Bdellovibrionaceae bacterium]|nr:ParB/RepB/Spo0J family partition protein [Pseudobdellovibrionaceae bacterium]
MQTDKPATEKEGKKRSLGRGLGSLLDNQIVDLTREPAILSSTPRLSAEDNQAVAPSLKDQENKVWLVSIEKIRPGRFQPRQQFDKESLQQLADSIKVNGVLQPIVVRRDGSPTLSFEIVAGERRWRAAQLAGLHEVPVIIRSFGDKEALELALIENIQREDLNPIEEAMGYQRLMEEFSLTQQQVAERVGKDRATIANAVRLLSLPDRVKQLLLEGGISVGHAKVLLSLEDHKKMISLAELVAKKGMSVRGLESEIRRGIGVVQVDKEISDESLRKRLFQGIAEQLQARLGTKVAIFEKGGRGSITIQFYSESEFNKIVEKLSNPV